MITEALIVMFVFFLGYITATVMAASKIATIASEEQAAKKEVSEYKERLNIIVDEFRVRLLDKCRFVTQKDAESIDSVNAVYWTDVERSYKEIKESLR